MSFRLMFFILPFISLLLGCSADRAEIRFTVHPYHEPDYFPEFQVTVRDGIRTFSFVLNEATPSAGPYGTRKSGKLTIDCVALLGGEETDTHGAIELPLKSDWRWDVDFFIAAENPVETCFGCSGWQAFELDPKLGYDENHKLYILWGGNSISDPVVY